MGFFQNKIEDALARILERLTIGQVNISIHVSIHGLIRQRHCIIILLQGQETC